jgi:hypothetical protein
MVLQVSEEFCCSREREWAYFSISVTTIDKRLDRLVNLECLSSKDLKQMEYSRDSGITEGSKQMKSTQER